MAQTLAQLDQLQHWVAEQLVKRRALTRNPQTVHEAAAQLTGNDRLLPVEQLDIYRQQFWLRHTSSLVEDFPGLSGIVGQAQWEELVEGYLAKHPPQGWTLRNLGRLLPNYVAEQAQLPHRALCTDMARLEWNFIELFDGPDALPLDMNRLAQLEPQTIEAGRIVLHPALRLLPVDFPVATLRQQLVRNASAENPEAVSIPDREPQHLVLYRGANLRLFHRPVPEEAFALLEGMQKGLGLVDACQYALDKAPQGAESLQKNVGHWFGQWAKRGWIVDVLAPGNTA